MKATAKAITNIKPMAGGVAIAQLQVGDYVYGDEVPTDIINFDHYYKPSGLRVELGQPCKAYKPNLTLTNEQEPTAPTDPPAEPPAVTDFDIIRQVREGTPQTDGTIVWSDWRYEGITFIDELP